MNKLLHNTPNRIGISCPWGYSDLFTRADDLCNEAILLQAGQDPGIRKEIAKTLTELVAEVVRLRERLEECRK